MQRGRKGHCAQREKEGVTRDENGAEKLDRLQPSRHARPVDVEEQRVEKDKNASRSGRKDRPPPPLVILARQLKVGKSYRNSGSNAHENGKSQTKNAVKSVRLLAPKRSEDVVEFH